MTLDELGDDSADLTTTYSYDGNDRLLTETADDLSAANEDRFKRYGYGTGNSATQRTSKTVYSGSDDTGPVIGQTTQTYNVRGRLECTVIDADGDG